MLTESASSCRNQLCGFLCHLPEPASHPLWLCIFGYIWHLKENEARVGLAKIHSRECHMGLPLTTLRTNNGPAEPTPGELWGLCGLLRSACSAPLPQLCVPIRKAVVTLSGTLEACDLLTYAMKVGSGCFPVLGLSWQPPHVHRHHWQGSWIL